MSFSITPFLGALSFIPTIFTPQPPPAQLLKVLTLNFNSETVREDRGNVLRDQRFTAMVDWVRQNNPDIILLQEVWNYGHDASAASTLARAIGYDVTYRLDMGFPAYMYDSDAVLARKSFHMKGEHDVKLPHSALDFGDGKNWIVIFGGVSYGVGTQLTLANGEPLYVYSTHLVGETESDRADQSRALDSAIRKRVERNGGKWETAKVIIAGDMNSAPEQPGPTFMRSQGYQDTWIQAHPDEDGFTDCAIPWMPCFNPFTVGSNQVPVQNTTDINRRIDYLYARGPNIATLASSVQFTAPMDGVWMSDHYGVMSTLAVNGASPVEGTVPNPVYAQVENPPSTTIIDLVAETFQCGSRKHNCEASLPEINVKGARGLTIFDDTGDETNIQIQGPGRVLPSPDAELEDGQVASFVFDRPGIYTYSFDNDSGDVLTGIIRVEHGL